jgi:hypothetical protein
VARHGNESVDYYARICGCSSGAMSKRLSELGEVSSRDRKAGYGLLENPFNPMDRRLRIVRLSAKGRVLVSQVVGAMGSQPVRTGQLTYKMVPMSAIFQKRRNGANTVPSG